MRRRTPVRRLAALAACVTLSATAALTTSTQAQAASNAWTSLSTGKLSNIDEPSLARAGSELQVVWPEAEGGGKSGIRLRTVSGHGVVSPSTAVVTTGHNAVIENPQVVISNGLPVVIFSGLGGGLTGQVTSATSTDGLAWNVSDTPLVQNTNGYLGYGTAGADDAGTLVGATVGSGQSQITINRGGAETDTALPVATCCAIDVSLARDNATGVMWVAWYGLTSDDGLGGIQAQPVLPTVGTRVQAPQSVDASGTSISPDGRVQLASASTGGVWAAYAVGYPTAKSIAVWKMGTTKRVLVPTLRGARDISLSAGPNGSLWLAWVDQVDHAIHATHSNAAVTAFGPQRIVAAPVGKPDYRQIWHMAIEGSLGPLDIVVNASTAGGDSGMHMWHQQILPPLGVTVKPVTVSSVKGGKVTVKVTEAGLAVPGVLVSIKGRHAKTNAAGVAVLTLPKRTKPGTYPVTATRRGYFAGKAGVRVN